MSLFVGEDDDTETELLAQTEAHVEVPVQELERSLPTTALEPDVSELPEPIKLSLPLKYQREIVSDLLAKDALLILGKGLGWEIIVANILYILNLSNLKDKLPNPPANRKSLLILLNANEVENHKIAADLLELQASMTVVGGESTVVDKRRQIYQKGGVVSITSRILVVDLLSEVLKPEEINGLFVLHAERIKETSNESFIVNLYRDQNEWGFIKAFSDDPESFTGFTPLASRLRHLKLSNTLLWPRFHVDVIESLSFRHKKFHRDLKTVNEINIKLSYKMTRIQSALLTCIEQCLKELIRHCQSLSTDYWDIENLYDPDFVHRIRNSLESHWHRLTQTPKSLVYDLGFLKGLLSSLLTRDSLTFYQIVQSAVDGNLRRSVNTSGTMNLTSMSPWLNSDVAPTITSYAKERALGMSKYVGSDGVESVEYNLEPLPKWIELNKLLKEIGPNSRILVMASDRMVVEELQCLIQKFIMTGEINSRSYMVSKLRGYLMWKELSKLRRQLSNDVNDDEQDDIVVSKTFKRSRENASIRRRTRGASSVANVNRLYSVDDSDRNPESADIDTAVLEKLELENQENEPKEFSKAHVKQEPNENELEDDDLIIIDEQRYTIEVQSFNSKTDDTLLNEFKPTHIIFYEPNLSFIRRVENYQGVHFNEPAKVYMMFYGTSAEEQSSLVQMKKEKEAFTRLIREKANLSKHFETKEDTKFTITKKHVVNTRIAGGQRFQTEDDEFRVIVDVREFNSSLPNLLYRVGSKVIPCMLTIGDYILTPKICVERKAIPDLIASFQSGRLYNQCEQMSRYYELPVLLIEFDEEKSFSFEPFSESRTRPGAPVSNNTNRFLQDHIQNKITMLLISFPKLKIIWSSSPYQTAQIFIELKAGEEAPDITSAINKGLNSDESPALYNEGAIDLLQSIPGINASNFHLIMNRVRNIEEMVKLTKQDFCDILGEENGAKAYNFINRSVRP
ncbi:DNA repair protein RAD16 [Yamadazyma tenuis]|uniref:ERCC4 domain-containing protein n=1 Tax=Candida tenuis (strain ATCC 10573 / BCRC 21748 / CBS 615 / JCM 9827 / NBRC 10315 / NRRL Y-1498 / VKM Y-70) TaxID=590646 RepID=G3B7S9_CANTC|nr:uncharacterized protein CANTEDRAFT_131677 [Yamadazyma tenuis ATCC 10573]EGV62313.1 hypothetical protein CANTEDRAFT_131677 [Yamadazyma tenuis ATCC 10573]WEJ93571.1 DNA repair protein RAD16 [Yamadazyma tenuis]